MGLVFCSIIIVSTLLHILGSGIYFDRALLHTYIIVLQCKISSKTSVWEKMNVRMYTRLRIQVLLRVTRNGGKKYIAKIRVVLAS